MIYKKFSTYLKEKYGEKVYKLPINLPLTCPNRDAKISTGGCTFCAEEGAGHESLKNEIGVKEQLLKNKEYVSKRYNADKFIAYFQNYTNTYVAFEKFKEYINSAIIDDIVEISISTRPDCINEEQLEFLKEIEKREKVNITIELGLQSINHKTLKNINRGHTLAEFIDAVNIIKKYNFEICTHLILNLPNDTMDDIIEASKILSALKIDQVKLHSLYLVKGTKMGKDYEKGKIEIISKEEYKNRVINFLRYLDPNIVIQRILGRVPEKNCIFSNWNTSWWKIKEEIEEKMKKENYKQGDLFNYLNGKCLK